MKNFWEQYEEDFLREVSSTMTAAQIAEKLERSEKAIFDKASRLGIKLTAKTEFRAWSDSEESLVSILPAHTVAERTGRSIYSIRAKRNRLKTAGMQGEFL